MRKATFFKTFILAIFFCLGLLISFFYQERKTKSENNKENTSSLVEATEDKNEAERSNKKVWEEQELELSDSAGGQTSISPAGKFTIVEAQKISADKTSVETGEDVQFWLTIKNKGTKVKTLTHLCFNHSGGTTFGCLLDHTLASGQEFSLSASTRFYSPGTYSVWFTWSQDKTNFYKPVDGSSVQIMVE